MRVLASSAACSTLTAWAFCSCVALPAHWLQGTTTGWGCEVAACRDLDVNRQLQAGAARWRSVRGGGQCEAVCEVVVSARWRSVGGGGQCEVAVRARQGEQQWPQQREMPNFCNRPCSVAAVVSHKFVMSMRPGAGCQKLKGVLQEALQRGSC
eukprot:scaffold16697_cov23-Tisochrysis_lutea.AAC.2